MNDFKGFALKLPVVLSAFFAINAAALASTATVTATRAQDFVWHLAVNVHMEYTDGLYNNATNVINDLNYLGINHVRDAALNPKNQGQSNYAALAAKGIQFDMIVMGNDDLPTTISQLNTFVASYPNGLFNIEGPNEINNAPVTYNGQTGVAAAQAFQQALFTMKNASSALSGQWLFNFTSYPDYYGAANNGNSHIYPKNGNQPYTWLQSEMASQAAVEPGKPIAVTEFGYYTLPTSTDWGGVDPASQAKMTLNGLFDCWLLHCAHTILYELLDAYPDPNNNTPLYHFGLWNYNGTIKPAGQAIHNMTTILADGGSTRFSFTPTTLNYTVTGLPSATGYTLQLGKSSGANDIVIWNEANIWDNTTSKAVVAPATPITLTLPKAYATVNVYDPLVGTTPVASYTNTHTISLSIVDHPLIVEVSAN